MEFAKSLPNGIARAKTIIRRQEKRPKVVFNLQTTDKPSMITVYLNGEFLYSETN